MSFRIRALLGVGALACSPCFASPADIAGQNGCAAWSEQRRSLSAQERQILTSQGVLRRNGRWIFSDLLIPDCCDRIRMAEYFERVIAGQIGLNERRFGWLHSREISKVTRVVWPLLGTGEAVPDDGSFDNEKWALLRQPWVHESDLLAVLQYEIDQQGLCPEAVVCLLERPILALTPKLRSIAGNPQKAQSQAVFALTLLQICGDDGIPQRLAHLRRYFETPADQKAIDRIREKIQGGSAVEWSDLETLVHEW